MHADRIERITSRGHREADARSEMSSESSSPASPDHREGARRRKKKKARKEAFVEQTLQKEIQPTGSNDQVIIERNWSCPVQDCLPKELRPQSSLPNDAKTSQTRVRNQRVPPHDWSRTMIRALCQLSHVTIGDMAHAHVALQKQVRQRQANRYHPQHYARKPARSEPGWILLTQPTEEVLTSDIHAVITKVKTLTNAGRYRPKQVANKIGKVLSGPEGTEAEDGYDEPSPEKLAAATMEISEDTVTRMLQPDREAQALEDSRKHLKSQASTGALSLGSQHVEQRPYAGDTPQQASKGLSEEQEKLVEEEYERLRQKYGDHV